MPHTGSSTTHDMIVVDDIWKSYDGHSVLKGLSLRVPQGKSLIILGRSGVGKSVLLRQILGLERPEKGSIVVDNTTITDFRLKEHAQMVGKVGMLFQSSALFDSMTVFENVSFYLQQHNKNLSREQIKKLVAETLEKVGLAGCENKMPAELSGGQKRRAALARMIIYRPKIMLFDEPTTGLDPITAMQISHLICNTQKELQTTSIVVTHDIHSALHIGDIIALHHEGKIAHIDNKDNFIKSQDPLITEFLSNAVIEPKFTKQMSIIEHERDF